MGISLNTINASFHSIAIKDSVNGYELDIDSNGYITAKINGTVTVDGTVAATQSGTWNIDTLTSITNDVNIADGGNSITVDAVDLDIRDLDAATDNIAVSDGTNTLSINADGSVNAQTIPGGFASWKVTRASVTTTESELVATPLAGRLALLIENLGSSDIYLSPVTGVSASNGALLYKGDSFEAELDDNANVFAITGSGSSDVAVIEYAA